MSDKTNAELQKEEVRKEIAQLEEAERKASLERWRPRDALREAERRLANLTAKVYVAIAREDYNDDWQFEVQGASEEIGAHVLGLALRFVAEGDQKGLVRIGVRWGIKESGRVHFYVALRETIRLCARERDLELRYLVSVHAEESEALSVVRDLRRNQQTTEEADAAADLFVEGLKGR